MKLQCVCPCRQVDVGRSLLCSPGVGWHLSCVVKSVTRGARVLPARWLAPRVPRLLWLSPTSHRSLVSWKKKVPCPVARAALAAALPPKGALLLPHQSAVCTPASSLDERGNRGRRGRHRYAAARKCWRGAGGIGCVLVLFSRTAIAVGGLRRQRRCGRRCRRRECNAQVLAAARDVDPRVGPFNAGAVGEGKLFRLRAARQVAEPQLRGPALGAPVDGADEVLQRGVTKGYRALEPVHRVACRQQTVLAQHLLDSRREHTIGDVVGLEEVGDVVRGRVKSVVLIDENGNVVSSKILPQLGGREKAHVGARAGEGRGCHRDAV